MDKIRKQPGYATSQIRLLLSDLKSTNHSVRSKAVKRFKDYIAVYKPEIFDDDVDYLFTGELDGVQGPGLLFYTSEESKKKPGQLKRISQPVLSLIKYLVTCDYDGEDNIFFDRFVSLSPEEYAKISFVKHILGDPASKKGVGCDSMDLIKIIVEDHKDANNCLDPVDINMLIGDNKVCRERLNAFLQQGAAQDIVQIMNQYQEKKAQKPKVFRPTTWAEVKYKPVPIQEGEDGEVDNSPVAEEEIAYPDPMALSDLDLRATQALYASGGLKNKHKTIVDSGIHDDEDDDDDDDLFTIEGGATNPDGTKIRPSILPFEKYFSSTLYLAIVHGSIAFNDFKPGIENLQKYLSKQRLRREDMARAHFGLFVMCTEGLEWMKQYRKGKLDDVDVDVFETDETKLHRAQGCLKVAKADAERALAPIMASMKKNRRIRNADQVLRRLASTLEYPHKMRQALDKGNLEDVISIYQRVQALPANSSLRILGRVKESSESVAADLKNICIEKLNTANANVKELLRHAKILEDMDGIQSFVDHIKQSFQVQLNHFNQLIDKLFEEFVTDAIAAYSKGQEMNTNAALSRDRSVTDASNTSNTLEIKPVRQGEYFGHNDDDDNEAVDDLDRILFDDIDTKTQINDKSTTLTEQVEKWKSSVSDHCISSCAEARLVYMEKFGDVIEIWLPCLHILAETHQQSASGLVQESKLRKITGAILKAIGDKKGGGKRDTSNLTRVLGQSLALISDMIRQVVFGFTGEIITPTSAQKKAALSLFKSRKQPPDDGGDSMDTVLSNSIFGLVLPEPYFTRSINQVTDLYDTIETCLIKSKIFKSANDGSDAVEQENHLSPTNPYYDALAVMRTMSKDGEVSLAGKVMVRLLNHFSNVLESTYNIDNSFSKHIGAPSFGLKVTSNTAESTTKELETLLLKGLNRIPLRLRRPDWISNCIHLGILNLFRSFVSFLKRLVLLSIELPLLDNGKVDMNGRMSLTNKQGNIEDLVTLEKNLRYNESKDVDIADTLLDVVKACVALRTRVISNVWNEAVAVFTINSGTIDVGEAVVSLYPTEVKFEKIDTKHRRPTVQILSSSQYGHAQLKDKLSKLYHSLQRGARSNVADVINVECDAVKSYIDKCLSGIRESVHSSYNVIVSNELAGNWKPLSSLAATTSPAVGNVSFPSHLSRIMLHLSNEKRKLNDTLDGVIFESGNESTVDTFGDHSTSLYKDVIFVNICQGLLQIYYDLIITLEMDTFTNLKHATNSNISSNTTTPVKKDEPSNPFQAGLDQATKGKDSKITASIHPLSQWQAMEEMEYLKQIFQPIFSKADNKFINELDRMAGYDKKKDMKHQFPGAGTKYCTTQQLLETGKVFSIMINK